jgi:hypothetical protein
VKAWEKSLFLFNNLSAVITHWCGLSLFTWSTRLGRLILERSLSNIFGIKESLCTWPIFLYVFCCRFVGKLGQCVLGTEYLIHPYQALLRGVYIHWMYLSTSSGGGLWKGRNLRCWLADNSIHAGWSAYSFSVWGPRIHKICKEEFNSRHPNPRVISYNKQSLSPRCITN